MRVISLWQPWASLVVMGAKKIETRRWDTKYRGPLLIHAAQKKVRVDERNYELVCRLEELPGFMENYGQLPYGSIIGRVDLISTHILCPPYGTANNQGCFFNKYGAHFTAQELAFGDYSAGRYGWLLANPIKFNKLIPAKGHQGFWNYDGPLPEINKVDTK